MILQIIFGIFTGIASPLMWTMYADVADYAEYKFNTASTGLIFSSSSMAQKFGGAFGAAAVMWLLAAFGYNTFATDGTQITDNNKTIEVVFKDKIALNTNNNAMNDTLWITGDNDYKTFAIAKQDPQKLKLSITDNLPNGEYKINIPEGFVTREKDNASFTGEVTFTSNENGEIIEHAASTTTKQTSEAIKGLRYLISWIPASIAILSVIFIFFYPLTTKRMKEINKKLKSVRNI
jgi:Na+/melibiose symporter-like transporter